MSWAPVSGPQRYKLGGGGAPSAPVADSGLTSLATPSLGAAGEGQAWHPSSPLFAFGALAAITFGLMAFSTSGSVRLGKATATLSGSVGKK